MTKEITTNQEILNQTPESESGEVTDAPEALEASGVAEAREALEVSKVSSPPKTPKPPEIPIAGANDPKTLALVSEVQEKANFEVTYNTRNLEAAILELSTTATQFDRVALKHADVLANALIKLREETHVLNKLPKAIIAHLDHIIPSISAEFKKQIFKDLDDGLMQRLSCFDEFTQKAQSNIKYLEYMTETVKDIIEDVASFHRTQLKRKAKDLILVTLAFFLAVAGASYFMYKKFPSTVWLNTYGDVHVDGGEIKLHQIPASKLPGGKVPKKP